MEKCGKDAGRGTAGPGALRKQIRIRRPLEKT
jgi:hypothetical protein